MKKKLLMLFLGSFLLALQVMAQQVTITGKVTSEADGMPIPGATVKVKGSSVAAQANTSGIYTIKANKGDVLQFIYLGMTTKEQTVGASTTINVALSADTKALNEVVVTAFGIERSKRSLGYDAQSVGGPEIAQTQRDNFINALQGRVAGVTVTPTQGVPGASSQIIIRGAVSLDGDNQPLFVVDGLPISNNTFSEYNLVGQGTFNRGNDYGNRGMDINPEEIESVTILKGPEASALYGTQGASGAVVITTKRAKAGKAKVSYNNSFRMETAYRFPDVQDEFGGGDGGIFDEEVRTRTFFGARYPERFKKYDNLGAFYQTGFTQRHNAAVEGGTDALSVRTSLSYTDQGGVIPGTNYKSLNLRLTGTAKVSDKISTNASLNFISNKTDKTYKGASSPMLSVLTWPLVDDITNRYTATGGRRTITGVNSAEIDNPIWAMENNPNYDKLNRILSNIGLTYKPTNWLSFQGNVGMDVYTMQGLSAFHPESYFSTASGSSNVGGGINTFAENQVQYNAAFVATAKKKFGKFSPVLRVGYDLLDFSDEVTAQKGTKFYQSNFYSMNNTDPTTQRVQYTDVNKRKMGAFGQAELGYDDILYLTFTGRMDFSSTLPYDKGISFFYPATSLSFVFSDLAPFKKLGWLSTGKLRGSWGQSGKDPRYAYITRTKLIAQGTTGGGFATDVTLGNSDLRAEFTTSTEAGIDLGFFKDRLTANFSYYHVNSDGQITAPRLSYATGGILMYINSGVVVNNGFELSLSGTPIKKENFSWNIRANVTRVRGEIKALPGEQDTFYVSDTWLFDNVRRQYVKGSSVSALASREYMRNNNGDILINPTNGMPYVSADWTQIGDTAPDFGIGLNNTFTYKNFQLSFLFDIRKGGDIYNATELYLYARGMSTRTLDREEPRIIEGVLRDGLENTATPTKNNIIVIPSRSTSYYSTNYNTRDFIEKDINWLRLKDITLSYSLPKSFLAKTKVLSSASVFFTGTDLWLLTNYKGVDPSVNGLSAASGGTGGTGIDFGSSGLPRGYNFGLRVGF
ncbi:SusC/RagA family TonB-linked outer membrane protein [Nubsella zeaxanthinifaciens]|uniref:SusC/RagA family TonB-linked outer membrane protein n=1 Tax=Nubsella zeaxanthinifaciens TaxID=392412 RepID=UPI000DE3B952|nr:SusC/RagA family TonB-linked outer membrane protein [Nubsella zeaxanthinifaciens]